MKIGTLIVYHPNGELSVLRRPADQRPTLSEIQGGVGGHAENASRFCGGPGTRTWAYWNEEPWTLKGEAAARNLRGSAAIRWPDVRVGPIVVTHGFDPDPEDRPIPPICECAACVGADPALTGQQAVEAVEAVMAGGGR